MSTSRDLLLSHHIATFNAFQQGGHGTEVAFMLLTLQPRVRISALQKLHHSSYLSEELLLCTLESRSRKKAFPSKSSTFQLTAVVSTRVLCEAKL